MFTYPFGYDFAGHRITSKEEAMLVLSRKIGESIEIGDEKILVRVLSIRRSKVQLGVDAPPEIAIHRSEMRPSDSCSDFSAGLDRSTGPLSTENLSTEILSTENLSTEKPRQDAEIPPQSRQPHSLSNGESVKRSEPCSGADPRAKTPRSQMGMPRKPAAQQPVCPGDECGNDQALAERIADQGVRGERVRRLGESLVRDIAKIQSDIAALASLVPERDQALAQRIATDAADRLSAVEQTVQRVCRSGPERPIAKFLGVRSRELLRSQRDDGSCEDHEGNRPLNEDDPDWHRRAKNGSSAIRESSTPFTLSASQCPLGSAN